MFIESGTWFILAQQVVEYACDSLQEFIIFRI